MGQQAATPLRQEVFCSNTAVSFGWSQRLVLKYFNDDVNKELASNHNLPAYLRGCSKFKSIAGTFTLERMTSNYLLMTRAQTNQTWEGFFSIGETTLQQNDQKTEGQRDIFLHATSWESRSYEGYTTKA